MPAIRFFYCSSAAKKVKLSSLISLLISLPYIYSVKKVRQQRFQIYLPFNEESMSDQIKDIYTCLLRCQLNTIKI